MSSGERRPRPLAIEPFDPRPSIRTALELLEAADVPYALAGRLAVWAWVPADDQEFTKDVDFAVPTEHIAALEAVARQEGFEPRRLAIGGFAIRSGTTRIDFIDRHIDFGELYREAVETAARDGVSAPTDEGGKVPVVLPEHIVAMKLATGDPRDERDVERLLLQDHTDYARSRAIVRQHLGAAAANRLDHIGARVGVAEAARYVRESNGAA